VGPRPGHFLETFPLVLEHTTRCFLVLSSVSLWGKEEILYLACICPVGRPDSFFPCGFSRVPQFFFFSPRDVGSSSQRHHPFFLIQIHSPLHFFPFFSHCNGGFGYVNLSRSFSTLFSSRVFLDRSVDQIHSPFLHSLLGFSGFEAQFSFKGSAPILVIFFFPLPLNFPVFTAQMPSRRSKYCIFLVA